MRSFFSYLSIAMVASIGPVAAQQGTAFKSRFEGFYAGVTGGYDFKASNSYLYQPRPTSYFADDMTVPVVDRGAFQGPKTGVVSGYNATFDRLLLGVEGRAQYGFASRSASHNYVQQGILPTPYINVAADFFTERERTWQFDLVGRLGVTLGDWLIFGKLGGGIEQINTRFVADWSKSRWCIDYPQCTIVSNGALNASNSDRKIGRWVGYGIVGAGIERNFGPIFARLEGELIAHELSYYTPAANLTLGYRF